jgi:multicomponent Na+:H+ antiporter subunit B
MTTGDRSDDRALPFQESSRPHQPPWLLSGEQRDFRPRTLLLEMTTRTLFPTVLVFSVYLLLVGHYGPGGGFAAGLVAGLAFVLRYMAGGGSDLGGVVRVRPPVVIGLGLTVALLTALVPVAFGAPVLATTKLAVDLPVAGHLETQTSVFLDTGVYLLIIGVVLDLLRSLGAGVERDMRDAGESR